MENVTAKDVQHKPSPHKYPWCSVCVSKNSEHETTKEWVAREIKELEKREKDAICMVASAMGRIYKESHGVIRWDNAKKVFIVCLERLWKERINRKELVNLLRFCVELMMDLVPTFKGIRVDIMKEQKTMLTGYGLGRFTQRRVKNGMIEWFKNSMPNKCYIKFLEKCRDTGIDTQPKYRPAALKNLHCMGGNENAKLPIYCRPISF